MPPSSPRIECVGKPLLHRRPDHLLGFAIGAGDRRVVRLGLDGDAYEVRERPPPGVVGGVDRDVEQIVQRWVGHAAAQRRLADDFGKFSVVAFLFAAVSLPPCIHKAPHASDSQVLREILDVVTQLRDGHFSTHLTDNLPGVGGEIASCSTSTSISSRPSATSTSA